MTRFTGMAQQYKMSKECEEIKNGKNLRYLEYGVYKHKNYMQNIENVEIVKKLKEFNKFAEELFSLSFVDKLEGSGYELDFKRKGPVRLEYKGPDDEAIKAFINDIRRFFQNRDDTLKIHKLIPIYKSDLLNDREKKIFNQVMSDLEKFNRKPTNIILRGEYLFSWDEIPGNDNGRLIDLLEQKYEVDWVNKAKIEKINDGRTIRIAVEKNYLSLSINDVKPEVNLKIDDGRTYEFITNTENGKLNIYKEENITNERVWEVFLYGRFSHRSNGTKETYDNWERSLAYVFLKNQFITVLHNYLVFIDNIVYSNNQILKRLGS